MLQTSQFGHKVSQTVKKTDSNSSIIFALKSRSLPAFSALLQAAQPALVHELGKKLVVNSNSTLGHISGKIGFNLLQFKFLTVHKTFVYPLDLVWMQQIYLNAGADKKGDWWLFMNREEDGINQRRAINKLQSSISNISQCLHNVDTSLQREIKKL